MRDTANAPWRDLLSAPNDDVLEPVDFSADGKSLFVETSLGTDTNRLVRVDLATGKEVEVLATDPRCDVGPFFVHPDRHVVQAVGCNYTRLDWKVLDPSVQDDFAGLKKVRDGDFSIVNRDRADKTWIGQKFSDTQVNFVCPWHGYEYDMRTGECAADRRLRLKKYNVIRRGDDIYVTI